MIVSERLRVVRERKGLSQGDIEKRTGLLRCYISRVENGHTVPAVETLEKIARALEIPLYQFLYDGDESELPLPKARNRGSETDVPELRKFHACLSKMDESDRQLLLFIARRMAAKAASKKS